jgi:hypothetical protein
VAVLPGMNHSLSVSLLAPGRSAVVVAPAGAARAELINTITTLQRMQIAVAGVVIEPARTNGHSHS